ncbi:hypothetical protein ACWY4P_04490 [Streptomyces sp. LZ34]
MNTTTRGGVVRRALCRAGIHRVTYVSPASEPCLRQQCCVHCDRLLHTRLTHRYGPDSPTDHVCATLAVCAKCGHERKYYRHQFYRGSLVADLPPERRPKYVTRNRQATPCDYVHICHRCGDMDRYVVIEHDWDTPRWGGRCRRCAEFWVDDGDD